MILKSVGCSINYGKRNVQKKVLTFWSFFCFLARPFVSFVSHIARYAPSSTDKSLSLKNQKSTQPNFYPPVSEHLFGVKIIKRAVHGLLRKWEEGGNGRRGFAVAC